MHIYSVLLLVLSCTMMSSAMRRTTPIHRAKRLVHTPSNHRLLPLTHAQRRSIAEGILAIPDHKRDLPTIGALFNQENKETNEWFKGHSAKLQHQLADAANNVNLEVKMMGSRRWGTTHLLSDSDAVIVTSARPELIMQVLSQFYKTHYRTCKQTSIVTKAGLHLLTLKGFHDTKLGQMKLEYTIQTPQINLSIITGMQKALARKFTSPEEITDYALKMMEAVYHDDLTKQLELKEWTRVLSNLK